MITARIFGWIDREWETFQARYSGPLLAICPWLAVLFFQSHILAVGIAAAWTIFWTVLFGWRGSIWVRKITREGDREYDRGGKFNLAKDYWTTESATVASKRRQRKRERSKPKD